MRTYAAITKLSTIKYAITLNRITYSISPCISNQFVPVRLSMARKLIKISHVQFF